MRHCRRAAAIHPPEGGGVPRSCTVAAHLCPFSFCALCATPSVLRTVARPSPIAVAHTLPLFPKVCCCAAPPHRQVPAPSAIPSPAVRAPVPVRVMDVVKRPRSSSSLGWLAVRKGNKSLVANLSSRTDVKEALLILSDRDEPDCVARGFHSAEAGAAWVNSVSTCIVVDADDHGQASTSPFSSQPETEPFSLPISLLPAPPASSTLLSDSTNFGRLAAAILAGGQHTFITGGAGVGKTTLLRTLQAVHKADGGGPTSFAVIAPSGVAALSAGGVTCHSFFGLTPKDVRHSMNPEAEAQRLVDTGVIKGTAVARILSLSVLCIDEISMVSGTFFSLMIAIFGLVRRQNGMTMPQLLTIGDFYQLPPVRPRHFPYTTIIDWAFKTAAWTQLFGSRCIELTTTHRQTDTRFSKMLQQLRRGTVTPELRSVLQQKVAESTARGVKATESTLICALKGDALDYNHKRLVELANQYGGIRKYNSLDRFYLESDAGKRAGLRGLDADLHVPACLNLSLHSRVSYCGGGQNMADVGIVNGSSGEVVKFDEKSGLPVVRFQKAAGDSIDILCEATVFDIPSVAGGTLASREQLPLHLSWAITVHRCQSVSLDEVTLDLGRAFCHGMVYVALSRVRSLDGLRVLSFDADRIVVDHAVHAFYEGLERE